MNIRKLDLNLLVILDALLDERNVTRAAARLGMSQPAVSAALARLRRQFGDPLFIRAQRGLIPTAKAVALAEAVKGVIYEAQTLLRPASFDPAEAEGRFTIATTDYMQATVVVPLLEKLRTRAPGLAIIVRSLELSDIRALLERGDLDLAITIPEFAASDLQSRKLYRERYVGAARKGHPILNGRLTVQAFCSYPHAFVAPRGGPPYGPVDEALTGTRYRRNIALTVPSFLVLPYVLRSTDLVVTAPERLIAGMRSQLSLFELPLSVPEFDVIAVWHPRAQNDARHRWVRGLLAEATI